MRPSVIGVIVLVIVMALVEQAWTQSAATSGEPRRLTLQQAIQTALDKHPALQSATFAVQGAEARAKQAESPYYPQVGGAAFHTNGSLRANCGLATGCAELRHAMGIEGSAAYTVEAVSRSVEPRQVLGGLLAEAMDRRPELLALRGRVRTAEHRIRAANTLNYRVLQVVGSAGDTEHISNRPNLQEGGWWGVGGVVSVPLFTGFLIQNQVAEATAQQLETQAIYLVVSQNVQLEVKDSFFDLVTLIQQIKVAEQQVSIAREALSLASQRYKLGLSSIVEVTQSEVAVTAAETRLAETQYNAKISEARLRYAIGGIGSK